jgi:hypothetical protein
MLARVFVSAVRGHFDPAEDGAQEQAASASAGKTGCGPPFTGLQNGERAVANAAQDSRTHGGLWATERPQTESYFHCYFFLQITLFIVFCSFFEQISYSFFYSNCSNNFFF